MKHKINVALVMIIAGMGGTLVPSRGYSSGYEFEGVGARQVARGGAAIADADDWTAIYWNPGNIALASQNNSHEFGIEAFGGKGTEKDSNSLSSFPGVGAIFSNDEISSPFFLGALGGIIPVGTRGGIGYGIYTPLLQGSKFNDTNSALGTSLDYESSAGIVTTNVSGSYRISDLWSAGAGLDVTYGRLTNKATLTTPVGTLTGDLRGDGVGLEGVFGVRYNPHPQLSVGAVYRTGSDVPIHGVATASSSPLRESSNFRFSLRQPPTSGVGIAYRPTPPWTLSMDFDQTYWHRFSNATSYDQPGLLLTNQPDTAHWRDTWKLRFGARFKATEKSEILGGYSYDRSTLDAASVDLSTIIDVNEHRFYGGYSYRWTEKLENIFGFVYGTGQRSIGTVHYELTGWQLMAEARVHY